MRSLRAIISYFTLAFILSLAGALPHADNHPRDIEDSGSLIGRQAAPPDPHDIQTTDTLLFHTTLPDFLNHRLLRDPPTQDWASDGCTDAPEEPGLLGRYNFTPCCQRHDFGYRNYARQGLGARFPMTREEQRQGIDRRFRADMRGVCRNGWRGLQQAECLEFADSYYEAVRVFGDNFFAQGAK